MSELNEPRIVAETGQEARIANIVEPAINDLGYRLVRVRLSGMNGLTLQIMAERPDGTMGIDDCEAVSRAISPVLDIEDPVNAAYNLEVSSPGIDRPLVRRSDFETWSGHKVKIETRALLNGRKRFKGEITAVRDDKVMIAGDDAGPGGETEFAVPLGDIAEAKLTLDDKLIREALRRDKALRHANRAESDEE